MQWLAEVCVRRPIFAAMLILALVVAGAASYLQLGIDRFPQMDLPTVYVRTALPGASSEEVETEVTQLLETAVSSVEGIDELRSISSDGSSLLLLTFNLNRNVDNAAQDVREAIGTVLDRLPYNTRPPLIRKLDVDASPIMSLAISGPKDMKGRELYVLADRYVKQVIERAPGVGQVTIAGAQDRAVQVEIDARQLDKYDLSIKQVHEKIIAENSEVPGGRATAGTREFAVRTEGRFLSPEEFRELPIDRPGGTPIKLKELLGPGGGINLNGQKEIRSLARLDGQPAVVLEVQRQSGANTMEVIDEVKSRLDHCRSLLPPDVQLKVIQDQSRYIKAAMNEIRSHLILGSILASTVVLLFMRSWTSTIIAAVAIPASIVASFAMMNALNFTLNNVTMLALVLMVGVVIDDAIVVLENIFHCIEEGKMAPMEAAVKGTKEIGLAVLATTFSLVIIFLPVSFLSSVAGRFLYQFGITASVAILVSLLVSFTLTPMMCSRMLKPSTKKDGEKDGDEPASRRGFYRYLDRAYLASLAWAMRHRLFITVLALAVIAANVPLYFLVQQDYVPTNVDESEFEVSISAPETINLDGMDKAMREVEAEIRDISGVTHTLTTVGSRGMGRLNSGSIYVRIQDIEERTFSFGRLCRETWDGHPLAAFRGNYSQRDVMVEVRRRLARFQNRNDPDQGLRVSVRNLTSLRQGAPVDIDFVLTGPELKQLKYYANELRRRAEGIDGIVDIDITYRDKREWRVKPDRPRAALRGVSVQEIADTVRLAIGGDDRVSRYRDPNFDNVYDVELRLRASDRGDKRDIERLLWVRGQNAAGKPAMVRMDDVTRVGEDTGPSRIDRLDRQRMIAVRANVAPGYALGDRIAALRQAADELGMAPGYQSRVLGRGRELERTLKDFAFAFILSLIFMYIILAAQFEHLVHPFTILISLPLAVPFGLLSLYIGRETLNLYSALGILVLFGVVKKNSILQVDHTNQLRAKGMDRLSAILQGNRDRLRPILMTTLAFVAGMLPLVVGTGPGAEERRSIAVLVLGGQTLSLLLTLLVTPVVYSLLDDLGNWMNRNNKTEEPKQPEPVAHPPLLAGSDNGANGAPVPHPDKVRAPGGNGEPSQ